MVSGQPRARETGRRLKKTRWWSLPGSELWLPVSWSLEGRVNVLKAPPYCAEGRQGRGGDRAPRQEPQTSLLISDPRASARATDFPPLFQTQSLGKSRRLPPHLRPGEPLQEPQTSLLISEPQGEPIWRPLGGQKEPPKSSRTLEGVPALAPLLTS